MKTSCSKSLLFFAALLALVHSSNAFSGSTKNAFVGRGFRDLSSSVPKHRGQQVLQCVLQIPRGQPLSSGSAEDASWLAKTFIERTDKKVHQAIPVEFVAETELPTDLGHFRMRAYRIPGAPVSHHEPIVIYARDKPPFATGEAVPVRVHDSCLTSEVFRSHRCDCKEQLVMALEYVQESGGCIIYLQQEGRGIGLANKIAAYALQDNGFDTVDANLHLGLPEDNRDYGMIPGILEDLKIDSVALMTNNPRKVEHLEALGVAVDSTVPMVVPTTNKYNRKYLETKQARMMHNNLSTMLSREATELQKATNGSMTPRPYASKPSVDDSVLVEGEEAAGVKASGDGYCFGRESVEAAIAAMARGEMVVVVDDMDRENEGDFIMAADKCTAEDMAKIVRYSSGVVCIGLEDKRMQELKLPPMVINNEDPKGTAFSVTVDATKEHGITTGISANDRAITMRLLADPSTTALDFNRPGHIFPLRAKEGGVLTRDGHTEASVDLARLAGCNPAGVLCEIVSEENPTEMMRLPEMKRFCKEHGYVLTSIVDLAQYRRDTSQ